MLASRSFDASALIVVFCFVCLAARLAADDTLSRRDGESLERKLVIIQQNGFTEAAQPRLTTVTQQEVNAYLRFQASDRIPAGVTEGHITIDGDSRVSAQATVDLGEVRRQRSSGGWLDPLSYLSGPFQILATGALHTANGVGRLEVESVTVAGVTVPEGVLYQVVRYYTHTPEYPDGMNLDAPFELPSRIREIRIGTGEAVIVQ